MPQGRKKKQHVQGKRLTRHIVRKIRDRIRYMDIAEKRKQNGKR